MKSKINSENMIDAQKSTTAKYNLLNLDNIEETETGLWIKEQLTRIRTIIMGTDGDEEMLEAIDFLIDDNDRWIVPELADAIRAGMSPAGKS